MHTFLRSRTTWILAASVCLVGILLITGTMSFRGLQSDVLGSPTFSCTQANFQTMKREYTKNKHDYLVMSSEVRVLDIQMNGSSKKITGIDSQIISQVAEKDKQEKNIASLKKEKDTLCSNKKKPKPCDQKKKEVIMAEKQLQSTIQKIQVMEKTLITEQKNLDEINQKRETLLKKISDLTASIAAYDRCAIDLTQKPTVKSQWSDPEVYDQDTKLITGPALIVSGEVQKTPCETKIVSGEIQLASYEVKSPNNYNTEIDVMHFDVKLSPEGDYFQSYSLKYGPPKNEKRIECRSKKSDTGISVDCQLPEIPELQNITPANMTGYYALFGKIRSIDASFIVETKLSTLVFNNGRNDFEDLSLSKRLKYNYPEGEALNLESVETVEDTVVVNYCKKSSECARLYDENGTALHAKELFCKDSGPVTLDIANFTGLSNGKKVVLKQDKEKTASKEVKVFGDCAQVALPEDATDKDGDGVVDGYDVYLAEEIAAGRIAPDLLYRVRNLTLDTKGASLLSLENVDSKMKEYDAAGKKINEWKTKYQKKGHYRSICNPPMLNISFDKSKSDGTAKPLFDARSTFPGKPFLQYQEIRAVDQCNAIEYGGGNSAAWFNGVVHPQLGEYFIFSSMRSLGISTVDVIDFTRLNFTNTLEPEYAGKTYNYMLLQRNNEEDDEMPFTKQFGLTPERVEDGKYDEWNIEWFNEYSQQNSEFSRFKKLNAIDVKNNIKFPMNLEMNNSIRYYLMTNFARVSDRGVLHNEEYAKIANSDLWRTVPHGFDFSMHSCTIEHGSVAIEMSIIASEIYRIQDEIERREYFKNFYTISKEIFTDEKNLYKMLASIDQYPYEAKNGAGKQKLKEYVRLRFYDYKRYIESEHFALITQQSFSEPLCRSTIPFASMKRAEARRDEFNNQCGALQLPPDVTLSNIVATPFTVKIDKYSVFDENGVEHKGNIYHLQGTFTLDITAKKDDLRIPKNNSFSAHASFPFANKNTDTSYINDVYMFSSYEIGENMINNPGPYYILPAGKTSHMELQIRGSAHVDDSTYIVPGTYEVTLDGIQFNPYVQLFPITENNKAKVTIEKTPEIKLGEAQN